ncbi:MAG: hypothetical protein F6K41_39230 [Symploca sp. SIO3E6]|nr:hypothetical protein [Caldora sp. SIO3E6]
MRQPCRFKKRSLLEYRQTTDLIIRKRSLYIISDKENLSPALSLALTHEQPFISVKIEISYI